MRARGPHPRPSDRGPQDRGLRPHRRHARPPRWSAATARSTGCACRASTPAACFAALLGDARSTAAGCSRPTAAAERVRRRYRDGHARARDRVRHRRRARSRVVDCMPPRGERAGPRAASSRARAGAVPMRDGAHPALRLRPHRALGAPARTATLAGRRRPRRAAARHARPPRGREPAPPWPSSTVAAGERGAVRAHLVSRRTPPSRRARRRPARRWRDTEALVAATGRRAAPTTATGASPCSARCSRSRRSPTRPPAASSPRRPPRCPSRSAACATGTTATAGCATPPSRCTRSLGGGYREEAAAWRDWLLRAVAGDPRRPADHVRRRRASAGSPSSSSTGCPATRARGRSASATPPSSSSSSTSTARCWTRCTRAREPGLTRDEDAWTLQPSLLEFLEDALAASRTRASGRSAARAGTSRTPR